MNIGQFVAAEIIIILVMSSVEKLITGLESFYDVLTSLEKIGQVVDKELEPQDGENPFEVDQPLSLELDEVAYTTPDNKSILKNINFNITTKDRMLLTGASGSGKTSLLKLISGLNEVTSGYIYINNVSMKGVMPNKFRSYVGQVLPGQLPFEGSILENITFGDENISSDQLHEVLKNLGLLSFIKEQPNGLQTKLYSDGSRISFTIARRIILARAIINNPKLLLLKDPLEHCDREEAKQIIHYLCAPERPWALIVASRNNLWEQYATNIIELKDGIIHSKNENDA